VAGFDTTTWPLPADDGLATSKTIPVPVLKMVPSLRNTQRSQADPAQSQYFTLTRPLASAARHCH
jgi:hypothetical protein